jgi:hypothetical protein
MFRMGLAQDGNSDEANLKRMVDAVQPEDEALSIQANPRPPCVWVDEKQRFPLLHLSSPGPSGCASKPSPLLVPTQRAFRATLAWKCIQFRRYAFDIAQMPLRDAAFVGLGHSARCGWPQLG